MDILKDFMDFVRRSYSRQRRQLSGGGAAQIPPRVASCSSSCPGVSSPGIPLTTTFSPPTSCFNYWTPVATYNSESPTIRFTQNATRDECVPSRWARCKDCGMTISPGICPSGWPAAYTAILNDVTTHYCCPLGATNLTSGHRGPSSNCFGTFFKNLITFTYNSTGYTRTFVAYPTTSTPRSTSTPSLTAIRLFNTTVTTYVTESDVTLTVYRGTTGSFVNTTFVTENTDTRFVFRGTLAADPIIVRFKENQISTSALGASTTSANPALPTPTLPTSTTTVVSSAGSENERLPTGAKAGIGAGVGIGVIALLALGSLFYYWRKRKANRDEKYPAIEQTGIEQQDSEGQRNPR